MDGMLFLVRAGFLAIIAVVALRALWALRALIKELQRTKEELRITKEELSDLTEEHQLLKERSKHLYHAWYGTEFAAQIQERINELHDNAYAPAKRSVRYDLTKDLCVQPPPLKQKKPKTPEQRRQAFKVIEGQKS